MQLQNSFTELFWNPVTIKSLPTLAISLITAAILGVLLGKAYVRFGTALSNRSQFARNFLLLTVTTTLIIGIVKSSLALSLGLVGALSIVRLERRSRSPRNSHFCSCRLQLA
jgi:ABC-type spermidine/putrescine transport system permease subunit II